MRHQNLKSKDSKSQDINTGSEQPADFRAQLPALANKTYFNYGGPANGDTQNWLPCRRSQPIRPRALATRLATKSPDDQKRKILQERKQGHSSISSQA
jgi:hypothetical protein